MTIKKTLFYICLSTCLCVSVQAGFLQPTKFPSTVADLSYSAQTAMKADDYMPYAGLSPYQIFQLQEMEDIAHAAIEQELEQAGIDTCVNCDENGNPQPQDGSTLIVTAPTTQPTPETPQQPSPTPPTPAPQPTQPVQPTLPNAPATGYCARRSPYIHTGQKIPFGLPVNLDELPDNASDRSKSIARNTKRGLFCSPYGCERGRPHQGVDIGCSADFYQMPIYATADGVVESITQAGNNSSAGNYIRLNHGDGWVTQYMHLDQMFVTTGQHVSAGCLIGLMGHTGGNVDQKIRKMDRALTHLHYEIVYYGKSSYIQTPTNTKIKITKYYKCGDFKSKIKPNEIMTYTY